MQTVKNAIFVCYRDNRYLMQATAGDMSLEEAARELFKGYRGLRSLIPHRKDRALEKDIMEYNQLVPFDKTLYKGGIFRANNMLMASFYSSLLGPPFGLLVDYLDNMTLSGSGTMSLSGSILTMTCLLVAFLGLGLGGFVSYTKKRDVKECQIPERILKERKTRGGPSPRVLKTQIGLFQKVLHRHEKWLKEKEAQIKKAKVQVHKITSSLG